MFSLREWGVLYGIVGLAYSLVQAWRVGAIGAALWKDMLFVALSFFLWPWVMLSVEHHLHR